jgi:hypothetical protein
MPQHDDESVSSGFTLIRALRPDWVLLEDARERLTSAAFKDGRQEASCFISEEVGGLQGFKRTILPELEIEFGFEPRIATIEASKIRASELWIYRKPGEFHGNPAHVVICPSSGMSNSKYSRQAGQLKDFAQLCDDRAVLGLLIGRLNSISNE